jgi:hypothetical protein
MSERNGDRARFQKERTRKMHRRQRIQALTVAVQQRKAATAAVVTSDAASSVAMHDEGGPMRSGD